MPKTSQAFLKIGGFINNVKVSNSKYFQGLPKNSGQGKELATAEKHATNRFNCSAPRRRLGFPPKYLKFSKEG